MFKKVICFLAMVCLFTISSYAAPAVTVDGNIHTRSEYNENHTMLQDKNHISNNAVTVVHLYWNADIPNYSLYLGVRYESKDFSLDTSKTAVEITVNGQKCTTFFTDGTMNAIDPDYFDVASACFVQNSAPQMVNFEMRIGMKYGIPENTVVGMRVFDFSGSPSNYYEEVINPSKEDKVTESETTTKQQSTTQKESKSTSAPSTTAKRTTKPVIQAATHTTTAPTKPPKVTTTKAPKTTNAPKTEKVTEPEQSGTVTQAETTDESTVTLLPSTTEESFPYENGVMIRNIDRIKVIGTALSASALTCAFMVWIFYAVNKMKNKKNSSDEKKDEEK